MRRSKVRLVDDRMGTFTRRFRRQFLNRAVLLTSFALTIDFMGRLEIGRDVIFYRNSASLR